MKTVYKGDTRYEKVYEQMQLLGIQDVTTYRQSKNGTVVWRLPILSDNPSKYIEYASFASGYVRNQGVDCRSNWQINKRVQSEPMYYPEYEYIKRANTVQKGNFVPKWKHEFEMENLLSRRDLAPEMPDEVTVIIDGHRYKVI
jgi:hypothetical protein